MSDLISRQALIDRFKQLKGSDTLANMFVMDVIKEIKKQPTSYDVNKVVEQLDKASDYYECEEQGREHIQMVDLTDAIEIVKAGGVNE